MPHPPLSPATSSYRVVSTHKKDACILDVKNDQPIKAHLTRNLRPVCGDYVTLERFCNGNARVSGIIPRTNHFARADRKGHPQIIAANIDHNIIVVAVKPAPTRDLINRYLVASHTCHVTPLLVFNKADLDPNYFTKTAQCYRELGYKTFQVSAKNMNGIESLLREFAGKTSILVGQSGVGKSSLSRVVLKNNNLKTGDLSHKTGKGAHVTSVTRLYRLPDTTGFLIDSPGVWEYGLWNMSTQQVAAGFIEFHPYLDRCKFNDCSHLHEPGCAVQRAVDENQIMLDRYQSYVRIVKSMKKNHEKK